MPEDVPARQDTRHDRIGELYSLRVAKLSCFADHADFQFLANRSPIPQRATIGATARELLVSANSSSGSSKFIDDIEGTVQSTGSARSRLRKFLAKLADKFVIGLISEGALGMTRVSLRCENCRFESGENETPQQVWASRPVRVPSGHHSDAVESGKVHSSREPRPAKKS